MWLRVAPTRALALLLLGSAVLAGIAAFWGRGDEVAVLLLAPIVVAAGVDVIGLLRQRVPAIVVPSELVGALRRALTLHCELAGITCPVDAAPAVPFELGGPVAPRRVRPDGVRATAVWSTKPRRRGTHTLGDVWLRLHSPLRLWVRRRACAVSCRVTVLPDLRGPADDSVGLELEGEQRGTALFGVQTGSELRALRPFQSGDDPRHVDWKATARHGTPIVRQWEPDRRRSVLVALDAGRLMRAQHDGESKFDAGLRALARLAMAAEARRDQVGAVVFAQKVIRQVPPLSGAGQAERLLRFVSDLSPTGVESDLGKALPWLLSEGRRSLVVIVTDVIDGASAQRLVAATAEIRGRHLPVVALLRDPHLDAAFDTEINRVWLSYRRAAAELVAQHRSTALALLRAQGVPAFDLSMRTIALEVVQSYLEISRGGWL